MTNEISENLLAEMDDVLKNEVAQRHSYFQLKYFLIGKEPTNQAKMWQCLRELKSRRESLEALDLETEETKDKIELLDISLEKLNLKEIIPIEQNEKSLNLVVLQQRELDVEARRLERQKRNMEKSLLELQERRKWIEQEAKFFLESFKFLSKIEPLRNFDDVDAQKEYWTARLSQKLNLKMLTQNQLDTELIETIISLPEEMPLKKQALGTLQIRHNAMIKQLQESVNLKDKKTEEN